MSLGPLGLIDAVGLIQVLTNSVIDLGLHSMVCIHRLLLLIHQVVSFTNILPKSVDLNVLVTCELGRITSHDFIPSLRSCLCTLVVSFTRHFGRLLDCIDTKDGEVSILLQIFLVCRDIKVLGYHSNLSGTIQSCEMNLGLEGELGHG